MRYLILTCSLAIASCSSPTPSFSPDDGIEEVSWGQNFEPNRIGSITGQVQWLGPRPEVPPVQEISLSPQKGWVHRLIPNPLTPQISPNDQIQGAVLYLNSVDPSRAKPDRWQNPAIVLADSRIQIQQSASPLIGFVPLGAAIQIQSNETETVGLRARGSAYFTQMFPKDSEPISRRFVETGPVELSSGTGKFWQRAYLWVVDHPYYTFTDATGQFELSNVPDGEYELICWMPNWKIARTERDPETGIQARQIYHEPIEHRQSIRVQAGKSTSVRFSVQLKDFAKNPKSIAE